MATPPVFTTGSVLTAAQMNGVGAWLITAQAVGTGVTSITLSNCFTSDFETFKVVAEGVATSTGSTYISINLNGNPSGWRGNLLYANFTGGAGASVGFNSANEISRAGAIAWNTLNLNAEFRSPTLARPTFYNGTFCDETNAGTISAFLGNTSTYTGFTITPASGTFTGGYIRVYGYRK